jgi:hypothetical protein
VTVSFQNNDTGVPHDFGVDIPGVPHTNTCYGPCSDTLQFQAPPGSFRFFCTVHIDMNGSFTVR